MGELEGVFVVGVVLGAPEGISVEGEADGFELGVLEGFAVGTMVGMKLGASVGSVGLLVGTVGIYVYPASVGVRVVGFNVGIREGDSDGWYDGWRDGSREGCTNTKSSSYH